MNSGDIRKTRDGAGSGRAESILAELNSAISAAGFDA
jgi:hypothetical protein